MGTSLNEIATQSKVGIEIFEETLPIRKEVSGICELLGFDPLHIANEGKLLAFVELGGAEKVLKKMKASEYAKDACMTGEVFPDFPGKVFMKTRISGTRIVEMLTGEQLCRIC